MGARAVAVATLLLLPACSHGGGAPAQTDAGPPAVDLQVLSLASWLGQLDPISETDDDGGVHQYGGLPALSAYFAADRAASPNTIVAITGESFGASPPLSSQFQDEPAIKALDLLGAKADTLSDHNFEQGIPYLAHLVDLATYPYVSTNMSGVQVAVSSKIAVPYSLVSVGPVQVALLGITSPDAASHALPGKFGAISITEPISAANAAASQARAAGAQVVIALADLTTTGTGIAGAHTGPLIDFATGLRGVDVVIGKSAGTPGTPVVGGVLVVEHTARGRTYGRTHLHLVGGVVSSATAEVVSPDDALVTPDPNAVALLDPYRSQLASRLDVKESVASATMALDGTERSQESSLGDLVADAFLAKYAPGGAQVAIMNAGGLRDGVPSSYAPAVKTLRRPLAGYAAGPPWDVVAGDVYTVLPFGDQCVLRPITGAVLWSMLEQSVFQTPTATPGFLQIAGFTFTYSLSAAAGARVQSVTLDDGTVITRADTRTLLLVDNTYLDAGGDNYGMLIQTPAAPARDIAAEVLLQYLETHPQLAPAPAGRITQVP